MALPPGTRIGAYEVGDSLGAGGMGEVYRARDTKLDRDVALKVLPEVFTTDPDGCRSPECAGVNTTMWGGRRAGTSVRGCS